MKRYCICLAASLMALASAQIKSQVVTYGDKDLLGTGIYSSEPTTGATLIGLAANAITFGTLEFNHSFPFSPGVADFANTDQIFTSTNQTAFGDGYSSSAGRKAGPQVFALDYSALVPVGRTIATLTLGIAADDFQFSTFGQAFTASINGVSNASLASVLNSLEQTGPQVQFFSIGVAPSSLLATNTLTLTINQSGDGRDGWAVDFLTIGVTLAPVPEPASLLLLGGGVAAVLACVRRRTLGT